MLDALIPCHTRSRPGRPGRPNSLVLAVLDGERNERCHRSYTKEEGQPVVPVSPGDFLDVAWSWVRGHVNHEYNEMADGIAGEFKNRLLAENGILA